MEKISKNRLKEIAQLKQKKYRQIHNQILVEGKRTILQLVENNFAIDALLLCESTYNEFKTLPAKSIYLLEDWQFQKISSTKTPQTIAALVNIREHQLSMQGFHLYLDDIHEPGNLGTIFRTASAAGVKGILLSPDCCDIYNPKVVRSSLGAVFTMPSQVVTRDKLINSDSFLIASVMDGDKDLYSVKDIPEHSILVMGSEAFGIKKEIIERADLRLSIPMSNNLESLNVAMAMGIITFHLLNATK